MIFRLFVWFFYPVICVFHSFMTIVSLFSVTIREKLEWLEFSTLVQNNKRVPQQKLVAIITGASSGIGEATAAALAHYGYHVILACRNSYRTQQAIRRIHNLVPRASVHYFHLDLTSFKSIKEFVNNYKLFILQLTCDKDSNLLNLLINNAGLNSSAVKTNSSHTITSDGFEYLFQCNYLGHFLLTKLLFPFLLKSNGRIINISSSMHRVFTLNHSPDFALFSKRFNTIYSYSLSKLAMLLFTYELQRRYASNQYNTDVTAIAVNPGAVFTNIWSSLHLPLKIVAYPFMSLFFLTKFEGAFPIVNSCFSSLSSISNLYYFTPYSHSHRDCECRQIYHCPLHISDYIGVFKGCVSTRSSLLSYDKELSCNLWEYSMQCLNEKKFY